MLLHGNHLFVLLALLLKTFSLAEVFLCLLHLLLTDSFLLVGTGHIVPVLQFTLFMGTLLSQGHFFIQVFLVALTDAHDIVSLLFRLFNFLPGL